MSDTPLHDQMWTMYMNLNDISFNFKNRKVVVVGASRGIGLQVAKSFLFAGAEVICLSRTNPDIKGIRFLKCDISNEEDINNAFANINNIDFLINVAGTNLCETIDNIDSLEWDRVMDINLKSFFLISKKAIETMKARKYGRIVNVSSIAGRNKSIVSGVHYTSSKYGIIGLTKQMANETSKDNILINCVCPSQTKTEMLEKSMTEDEIKSLEEKIPIRRIASCTEQALPILFLCSSAASYITGATLDINGGQL